MMISVTVLTRNSPKYLREVLSSLQSFDEVVIYDTGSTDNTLDIAREFPNVNIFKERFEGFGPSHNKATACAKHDWIRSEERRVGKECLTKCVDLGGRRIIQAEDGIRDVTWCDWSSDVCSSDLRHKRSDGRHSPGPYRLLRSRHGSCLPR